MNNNTLDDEEFQADNSVFHTDGHYTFQAAIFNTGFSAVNVQTIQIVNDQMHPLALGIIGGLGKKAFIQPQQFFCAEIPLINYDESLGIESFCVEVMDIEGRIYSQEFLWVMG